VWTDSPERTIAHLGERAAEFRRRSETGTSAERVRGRLIAGAYQRAVSLLEELRATDRAAAQNGK